MESVHPTCDRSCRIPYRSARGRAAGKGHMGLPSRVREAELNLGRAPRVCPMNGVSGVHLRGSPRPACGRRR
ncbi:hypothetical protein [Ornithinimicrobium kibberense]|uniref:hypothetical protein n=1 Tax=Ornithinimicrobium kibberense TaxID=282060 RepID=UPI00360B0BB0